MKLNQLILAIVFITTGITPTHINAQEANPFLPYKVAPQNLLKFNRFLLNPTFSTVREDKSYVNFLHRNQSVQFQDNDQTYFLSYSGRIGDRSGLGLSLYSQKSGLVSNVGVLANYAYGIKLSAKSNFTFGGNIAYYSSGLNLNEIDVIDQNDVRLMGIEDNKILSFQPGFNISYGKFDFGVFAENLIDYNLKTSKPVNEFNTKTYTAHIQYTHRFANARGIFESARIMPLGRITLSNQDNYAERITRDLSIGGSLILGLPKVGWLQGGYDKIYGASAGVGFNINKRFSLGYTMEKNFGTTLNDLGVTHEVSFAYSFTPNLTEDRVLFEDKGDDLVLNSTFNEDNIVANDKMEELKRKLAENDAIIEELMFRQDSIEAHRQKDLEHRFQMMMRMVRNETKGQRPDIEKRAANMFLEEKEKATEIAGNTNALGNKKNKLKDIYNNKISCNDAIIEELMFRQDSIEAHRQKDLEYRFQMVMRMVRNETRGQKPNLEKRAENMFLDVKEKISTIANQRNIPGKTKQYNGVKSRKFENIKNIEKGYYMIANVYKNEKYMTKFISKMNDKGFHSNYIKNPDNGLKYVYLKRFDTWQEAEETYKNHFNGTYADDLWVMNLDNGNSEYTDNVNKLKQISAKYKTNLIPKNSVVKDKLTANEIRSKTYMIDASGSRYYIIANVFANPNNAKRFIALLNTCGVNASYFINPENNWHYVYLKQHESWNSALLSYYTKLNNSYTDKMWIMRVTQNLTA